ncbi:MAG: hypothetical protein C0404_12335 [Verrucomicrobia bacterium]|nr:hypothetical protein [Verrucomicrobiota bacterium]
MKSVPGRLLVCLAAAAVVVTVGGCIKSSVLVQVGKDGKGQVVVSTVVPRDSAAMMNIQMQEMRRYSAASRGTAAKLDKDADPFYNEKALKAFAKKLGPNVKFVKGKKIDYAGSRGSVAVYSFEDISEVTLDMGQMGRIFDDRMNGRSGRDEGDEDNTDAVIEKSDKAIEFKFVKGATPRLQVTIPDMEENRMFRDMDVDEEAEEEPAAEDAKNDDEEEEERRGEYYDEMITASIFSGGRYGRYSSVLPSMLVGSGSGRDVSALKGMQVAFAVEVDGEIVSTTSKNVDEKKKNRVAIIDIDMDKAMASEKGKKSMEKVTRYGSPDQVVGKLINKVPGMVVETNRLVSIDFK